MMQCIRFMICRCNVCACELICCTAVWLKKINPWMLLRTCWISMSWSCSTDELLFREINYVARNVWCNVLVLLMFVIYGCNVCACELICCIAICLRKMNPWMPLRICWIFMSWSWSTDELLLREVNSVVRAMPCTACKVCWGVPRNSTTFCRGLITGNFVPLGI